VKLSKWQRAQLRWAHDPVARDRGGWWITLIIYAVLFVVAELLRPKPEIENAKPSGLGDFRFPTATEGRYIPLTWGRVRIEGQNVIWYGDLRQEAIKQTVKTGLFSSQRVTVGYRYFLGVQHACCLGPVDEWTGLWIGDDEITGVNVTSDGGTFAINEPNLFGGEDEGQGGVVGTFQFFKGTNAQAVSGYLSAGQATGVALSSGGSGYAEGDILTVSGGLPLIGGSIMFRASAVDMSGTITSIQQLTFPRYLTAPSSPAATTVAPAGGTGCTVTITLGAAFQSEQGDTPAYHDLCYFAPYDDATYLGTSSSIKPWKFEIGRYPNGLSLTGGKERVDFGANPACVLYEILTNADWGYGIDPADIDATQFATIASDLYDEGNGFSFLLDRPEDLDDLLHRVEEQIDGLVRRNRSTKKYELKLIRDDYDINTVPELDGSNVLSIETFTRSSYDGTTNQVRVPFADSGDQYKETYGFAQDMANVRIVGYNTTAQLNFPGVKTAALANAIAWRKLRTLAIPLAQATLLCDRSVYALQPGDPFGLTDADLGFDRLPMRVKRITDGDLVDGTIRIEAVQDVFKSAAGVFQPNPSSGWTPPGNSLIPFPAPFQVVFESPRMFNYRDDPSAPYVNRLFAAARHIGPETRFDIRERNAVGTPSGAYSTAGTVVGFQLIGLLDAALGLTTTASATITLQPMPDTQAALETAIEDTTDLVSLGVNLTNLLYVVDSNGNGEFMLASVASNSGPNVQITVYRGIGDSVQRTHAQYAFVYLLSAGGGLSDSAILSGNNVDVKLIPRSAKGELDEADAITVQLTIADRSRLPYPPSSFQLNNVTLDTTNVDLDGSGSGEDVGVLVDDILRRDFRALDEIGELGQDAATIHADFPTANNTTTEVEVRDGATVVHLETGISGTSTTARLFDILQGLDTTSLPSSLTFATFARHDFEGSSYRSFYGLEVTATVTDARIGKFAFGARDTNIASAAFTVVADTVDHVFNLSAAFTAGDVEYRINGGSWTTLITAGGTGPGTIPNASLTNGDTIEVRHTSSDSNAQHLLDMTVSGTIEAYAVLYT